MFNTRVQAIFSEKTAAQLRHIPFKVRSSPRNARLLITLPNSRATQKTPFNPQGCPLLPHRSVP